MKWRLAALLAAFSLLFMTGSISAHHSTAMYDNEHPVTVTGSVKKFDWTNPHAFIYLEERKRQHRRVGSRNDEPQSSSLLRLDEQDCESRGYDLVHGFAGKERRAVHDQQPHEARRRARDPVLESRRFDNER